MIDELFECKHVTDVYNEIAKSFDKTRTQIWPKTKLFFDELTKNDNKDLKILDVGCGNGRNIIYLKDNGCTNVKGCDVTNEFVLICKEKNLDVQQENIINLSYPDNSFDVIICIAVIHHLSTEDRRIKAIEELVRIVKPGGKILIQVWAFKQVFSKVKYTEKDVMIPWHMRRYKFESEQIFKRYYHLFDENELETICLKCNIKIKESYWEHDNYGVIMEKQLV